MFLSESLSVRVTLMTQISQCTIPHSPYPKCYKATTRSANTNRQFFPGNFYNFARVDKKNILPGTNFLHISSGAYVAELDLLYRKNKQQSSKQLQHMYM